MLFSNFSQQFFMEIVCFMGNLFLISDTYEGLLSCFNVPNWWLEDILVCSPLGYDFTLSLSVREHDNHARGNRAILGTLWSALLIFSISLLELKNQRSSLEDAAARGKKEIVKLSNPSVRLQTEQILSPVFRIYSGVKHCKYDAQSC